MVGGNEGNMDGTAYSDEWSIDGKERGVTVLDDGRRVAVKPEHEWADPRIARLLHDVRSPYLPRCLGLTSRGKGDSGNRRGEGNATFSGEEYLDTRYYEGREPLPFLECSPSPAVSSIVFEWVDGRAMREVEKSELSSTCLEKWFDDILDGLAWLSQCAGNPIAHLDISPDNIVIAESGDALLIDFSGARVLDGRARAPETSRVYKEGYAAPEIFLGDLLPESDLYAIAKSILSVWCEESATTLTHSSIRGALRKLAPSFSERLRCCLSDDPVNRRDALRDCSLKPITEQRQLSCTNSETDQLPTGEDDPCPYSLATCPFLEVADIICGE